jgi:hypothetical protein
MDSFEPDNSLLDHEDCDWVDCVTCTRRRRRREMQAEADREAAFQRDVAGPMLGLTEQDLSA